MVDFSGQAGDAADFEILGSEQSQAWEDNDSALSQVSGWQIEITKVTKMLDKYRENPDVGSAIKRLNNVALAMSEHVMNSRSESNGGCGESPNSRGQYVQSTSLAYDALDELELKQ